MKKRHLLLVPLVPAAVFATLVPASTVLSPKGLQVGHHALSAAGCMVRETLWIDHYAAALYVPPRMPAAAAVQDPTRPKALRIQILNKTFMPAEVPRKWRHTLEKQLDGETYGRVRSAYKALEAGDVITFAYVPGPGVMLHVNGDVIATTPNHGVIDALLDAWADGEPVAERIGRAVKRNPCAA